MKDKFNSYWSFFSWIIFNAAITNMNYIIPIYKTLMTLNFWSIIFFLRLNISKRSCRLESQFFDTLIREKKLKKILDCKYTLCISLRNTKRTCIFNHTFPYEISANNIFPLFLWEMQDPVHGKSFSKTINAVSSIFPNGRTQHIISVVYENQCASDFSMKGWIFVQNIAFYFVYLIWFFCVIGFSPLVRAILCDFPDYLRKYQMSY